MQPTCPCIEPKKHGIVWIQQIMEPNCLCINAFVHILNQKSVVWFGFIKLLNQTAVVLINFSLN